MDRTDPIESPRSDSFPFETFNSASFEKYSTSTWGNLLKRKPLKLDWQDIRPTVCFAQRLNATDFRLPLPRIIFDYLLIFFQKGNGSCWMDGEKIEVKERSLLLIPPFYPHQLIFPGVSEHISIHFDWRPLFPPTFIQSKQKRQPYEILLPASNIPRHQLLPAYDPIIALLNQIIDERGKGDMSKLRRDAYLFKIIVELLERSQNKRNKIPRRSHVNETRIEAAVNLIQKNLTQKISREELIKVTGLSYSRFSYLFHQQLGCSPIEYLTRLRIQKAKELLMNFHLSIKEVGVLCGFENHCYFSKVFTHVEGSSPSQYREVFFTESKGQKKSG